MTRSSWSLRDREPPKPLEVPFGATDDNFVYIHRASRVRAHYELLLSLFVRGIKPVSNQLHTLWGIDMDRSHEGEPVPHMIQEFYSIPGMPIIADRRTPLAKPLIELIPDVEYYRRRGLSAADPFDLPQSLEAWMNASLACAEPLIKKLLRAGYWQRHAHQVFPLSQSASLVAAVQAIEVLLPNVKGQVCAQPATGRSAPDPPRSSRTSSNSTRRQPQQKNAGPEICFISSDHN
jgi:hypothetical protein